MYSEPEYCGLPCFYSGLATCWHLLSGSICQQSSLVLIGFSFPLLIGFRLQLLIGFRLPLLIGFRFPLLLVYIDQGCSATSSQRPKHRKYGLWWAIGDYTVFSMTGLYFIIINRINKT